MSSTSLDPIGLSPSSPLDRTGGRDAQAVRQAAIEFEALLLSHLTAALNPSEDEEEEGLFSGSATGMYRQMFSEQIAMTMARNGGIGLADTIVQQLGMNSAERGMHGMRRAVEAVRLARGDEAENGHVHPAAPANATPYASEPAIRPATRSPLAAETNGANPAARPLERLTEKPLPREAAQPVPVRPNVEAAPAVERKLPLEAPKPIPHRPPLRMPIDVELQLPLRGRITSQFGARRDPLHGRYRHHGGTDIAAPRGTPIAAAAEGTVVFAGRRGGYGNVVEIEHADGRQTRYAHADQLLVRAGDVVESGQPIATVGSTGRSTGPHLHFEVQENGARVDPLQAVAKDSRPSRR